MALGKGYGNQDCAMARGLELVGERWTLLIIRDAFYGVRRFSDFLTHLECPRAVLSERLHTLTEAGVFERRVIDDGRRSEYVLSERGLALWPVLASLSQWSADNLPDGQPPYRVYEHDPCGTDLPDRMNCPRCGVRARLDDIAMYPGPHGRSDRDDLVSRALNDRRMLLEPIRLPGGPGSTAPGPRIPRPAPGTTRRTSHRSASRRS